LISVEVERRGADPTIAQDLALAKTTEVRRYARLRQLGHTRQLGDRQLLTREERDQSETRRVPEQVEQVGRAGEVRHPAILMDGWSLDRPQFRVNVASDASSGDRRVGAAAVTQSPPLPLNLSASSANSTLNVVSDP
jgi:hypothetical protein